MEKKSGRVASRAKADGSQKAVKRIKQSIFIDAALYKKFQNYCDAGGLILSRKLEKLIAEFLAKENDR